TTYMNKIGFGEQPFLVYQHFDAGHPHLHIVTTTIREDGRRIDTYNLGRNQSEKARMEIEMEHGLVKAAGKNKDEKGAIEPVSVQRVKYGLSETKRSIANVVSRVINQYRFTSLAEFNAVLRLYNLTADPGSEESRTYRHHGLHYRLLDEKGNKVGVTVKASSIYCKPTLKFLEEKFAQNQSLRLPFKSKLKTAIDWTLSRHPGSIKDFALRLKKEHITAVIRENEQGFIYGITFIDHRHKTVFNGSDLGKSYSAAGIKERIAKSIQEEKNAPPNMLDKKRAVSTPEKEMKQDSHQEHKVESANESLWDLLMKREKNELRLPFDFVKRKKKRRQRKL
ncbi:MAG TPA: relaxase/mobilization nuclease domain-containing protein, partial [Flavisolibacter sp.]|nr:relaxase/mobilization nuclease domain-containing protein [Flavisolibacter sp.]